MQKPSWVASLVLWSLLAGLVAITMSACWQTRSAYELAREAWVDSVFNTLSQTEKIGQLFSVRAHSNLGPEHVAEVEKLVRDYKVGGLTFFQGGPYRQALLTNRYQSLARIPLMVAIDGEWGLGMRLDSTMSFPRQMTLGAIQEDSLVKEMGKAIARQCRRLGIHVNFAPVIDVNNNPNNPVINDRSFGEDKENVARKGIAYMEGLQSEGVLANAKHFPGHGDTDQDSHYTLPVILHARSRIDQMELYPFTRLFAKGLQSLMVAHLQIPALDQSPNRPTTLSKPVVTDLLQKEMGFEGLIFTDALGMQGVTKFYAPGEISVMALEAGNDVLLVPDDVPQAFAKIEAALQTGRLTWEMIDLRVKKILRAKYFAGLHQYKPLDVAGLARDLHLPQDEVLQARLFEKALTVVQNEEALLPFRTLGQFKMASVALGTSQLNTFQKRLSDYAAFEHFQLAEKNLPYPFNQLLEKLADYEVVVVSLHNLNKKSRENFGLTWQERDFIQKLGQKTKVVLAVFGSPYSLRFFESAPALVCAYEDNPITQGLVPQLLFGAIAAEGKLPVSASARFGLGQGVRLAATGRLGFGLPESVGMHRDTLAKIDEMAARMIESGAAPGLQIVIARQGQVVWNKDYGHHTYAQERLVSPETVYDVASITKVAATLPALMHLYEQGKIKLNEKVATYLPELLKTDKANITLRDVLTHQAGLVPYLPHWEKTVNKTTGAFVPGYYQKTKSEEYPRAVAKDLYGHQSLEDSLWRWTITSPSRKPKRRPPFFSYEYSDLSFYILKRIADKFLPTSLDSFVQKQFYEPMGMYHSGYLPLERLPLEQIPPTEQDAYFRQQLVHGFVHDQGAAMLGGVAGHAGLFANALDLAKYMQMQLQGGHYGGQVFFQDSTTRLFQKPFIEREDLLTDPGLAKIEQRLDQLSKPMFAGNRRGLGWDRKDAESYSYIPDPASNWSFGHSGFTGCVVWADPKTQLVMVFLSNRIHPSAENTQLITEHWRRRILNLAYAALFAPQ